MTLSWQHEAQDGAARAGVLHTAHGEVPTPVFMPVGTAGTVKAMTADAVRATGARMVLGNTYHLMLRQAMAGSIHMALEGDAIRIHLPQTRQRHHLKPT